MKLNLLLCNSVLLTLIGFPAFAESNAPSANSPNSWTSPHSASKISHPLEQEAESAIAEAAIPRLSEIKLPDTRAQQLVQAPTLEAAPADEDEEEVEITVTGTRSPRSVDQSPATVTVFDAEDIDRNLIQDIKDLLRYEPGVSAREDQFYGIQDYNIRGLEDNRVLIQVDGIRLPSRFEFGPQPPIGFRIGRDYVDLEALETIEILRGPASTLYGSDALGGVVSYSTFTPSELLALTDRNTFSSFSTKFSSATSGFANTGIQAFRLGNLEGALLYTRRDFRESDIEGEGRADSLDGEGNNLLGKLVYRLNEFNSLEFTGESFNRNLESKVNRNNLSLVSATTQSFAEQIEIDRLRFSLGYRFDNPESSFVQNARFQLYYQDAETEESVREQRFVTQAGRRTPVLRNGRNSFLDRSFGGDLQLQSNFRTGDVGHRLTYGLDISTTRNERPRDRLQTNLLTGVQTRNIPPDIFPVKDFPDSDTLRLGVYVQDEIEIGDRLSLIPGIRFDYYDLTTDPDEPFTRNGAEAVDFNSSSVSPKLGIVYQASPAISLYGQYARGFRAPLFNEINSGFTNLTGFFRYRTLPNPDLKPEKSNSFELGMRGNFSQVRFGLTGFYNRYDDFIEAFADAGTEFLPGIGTINVFQSRNVSEAEIYGIEARAEYRFTPSPDGFSLFSTLGWVQGNDLTRDEPLETINPFKAVLGLRYRGTQDRWGAQLAATFVGKPRVSRADRADRFVPDSYTTVDLIGYYKLSPTLSFNVGVFNLFDVRYFDYSEVRPLNDGDPRIDLFAQPGINISAGFNWQF